MAFTGDLSDMSIWMSQLPDNRKLQNICLPASHDAAIYGKLSPFDARSSKVSPARSRTQHLSIRDQLEAGVRVFDLRFTVHNNKLHSVHKAAGFGHCGPDIDEIFGDVQRFMATTAFTSELIILRISKSGGDELLKIHEKVASFFPNRLMASDNEKEPLLTRTLGQLRGQVAVLFESKKIPSNNTDFNNELRYAKKEGDISKASVILGDYSESDTLLDLNSPQNSVYLHQAQTVASHLKRRLALPEPPGRGLPLVALYWTVTALWWKTGLNVMSTLAGRTTAVEYGVLYLTHTKNELWSALNMTKLIGLIRPSDPQHCVNLVWHDFCSADTCRFIVRHGNYD